MSLFLLQNVSRLTFKFFLSEIFVIYIICSQPPGAFEGFPPHSWGCSEVFLKISAQNLHLNIIELTKSQGEKKIAFLAHYCWIISPNTTNKQSSAETDGGWVPTVYFIWKFWTRLRSTNMRTVASVVSVSDSSKSLKVKSRRRRDWADGTVATFKHTHVLGSEGDTAGQAASCQMVGFLPGFAQCLAPGVWKSARNHHLQNKSSDLQWRAPSGRPV